MGRIIQLSSCTRQQQSSCNMKKLSKSVFCERLKSARGSKTQSQMAEALGMKQQMYARYETGVTLPSAEVLFSICVSLGISADWLLGVDQASGPGGAASTTTKKGKAS